ncbi:MAG: ORF6N domain-containing protein [Burkholderiales bacterium]
MSPAPVPIERIERAILFLRGHKVMLDSDLAALYGVETRVLVQAAKRNPERFPKDFMFQLTDQELTAWRSQIGDGSSISVERMTITGHSRP